MAITVRTFVAADNDAARALFSAGMMSLVPALVRGTLLPPGKVGAILAALLLSLRLLLAATPPALAGVALALLLAHRAMLSRLMSDYVAGALASDCADIEAFYRGGGGEFWCATDDDDDGGGGGGALAGIVAAEMKSDEEIELRRMSVDPRYQGRGVASRLVKRLEAFGSERGFRRVVLSCSSVQHAGIALYRSCGYKVVREESMPDTRISSVRIFHWEKELKKVD